MASAIYEGRGRFLLIRATGTRLPRGESVEVTGQEAAILDGHPDVTITGGKVLHRGVTAVGERGPDLADYGPDVVAVDLDGLSRAELNERAASLGVEKPGKLPNKSAVIEAVREAS